MQGFFRAFYINDLGGKLMVSVHLLGIKDEYKLKLSLSKGVI